jgi:uncharacterized membrane protein
MKRAGSNRSRIPSGRTWSRERGFTLLLETAVARDVNDCGDIVGHYWACPPPLPHDGTNCAQGGFLWDAETGFVNLGSLLPTAINNEGRIVGWCFTTRTCVRVDGRLRYLPRGFQPMDINDRGVVAGTFYRTDAAGQNQVRRPAVWMFATGVVEIPNVNEHGWAAAINDAGMLAGGYEGTTFEAQRAAVWTLLGGVPALDAGRSQARGVSDRGWLVGEFMPTGVPDPVPVVWRLGREALRLPIPSGASGGTAQDVNDSGQIIGTYGTAAGRVRAVLWTVK